MGTGRIVGTPGRDVIVAMYGRNRITAGGGNDLICGGAGLDVIEAGPGRDKVIGGHTGDMLTGGPGRDYLDGGPGLDRVKYDDARGGVRVDLGAGRAIGRGLDKLFKVEYGTGSEDDDVLLGTDGWDWITGLGGDDTIILGEAGGVASPGLGDDTVEGGEGIDVLNYFLDATGGVTVDLVAGTATGQGNDMIAGIEHVKGTLYADTLLGNEQDNRLDGLAGDDVLDGREGNDDLGPDQGDDIVEGGPSSGDVILGGDTIILGSAGPEGADVDLLAGTVTAPGSGTDSISGIENVIGSSIGDVIRGDDGPNRFWGSWGGDVIEGRGGDDLLFGDLGSAHVPGHDTLDGGDGTDTCIGGEITTNCE